MTVVVDGTSVQGPMHLSVQSVVAVVVEWRGKIALLKRSHSLNHDRGRWHCVTGYIEPGTSPRGQALQELLEETGIRDSEIVELKPGVMLFLNDEAGSTWVVHTFTAVTSKRRLVLDWEHDSFRWTIPEKTARFANRVVWLDTVLEATGHLSR
ncbi:MULTISPECIES: NUDIX domain-containing protein [unclassified Arthrobacter]|uniref:NUDIX domain-containing protein n=1 Tax=unclassified Arthrobacter TaxID=235627 RepID=UPI002882F16E|nr:MULTISPECIES: NUDIX domain-containing protein [unclassified Arthrobacter]